jgi:hypothetical protein
VTAAVADAFVDALDAHGMDTVVGIGGTRTLRLLGALERRATTRFIAARTRPHCPRMRQGDRTPGSPTDIDRPRLSERNRGAAGRVLVLPAAPAHHHKCDRRRALGSVHEVAAQRVITTAAGKRAVVVEDDDSIGAVQACRIRTEAAMSASNTSRTILDVTEVRRYVVNQAATDYRLRGASSTALHRRLT